MPAHQHCELFYPPVSRDTCMKGESRRTLGGDSGKRTPSKGLLRDINLSSCVPMSSCIPLYLLDADDPHSTTALALKTS